MKKTLGHHILAEMYGCKDEVLNNRELIERIMIDSALEAGAEVREVVFHKFSPQGVSGVVVISESHLAIHTWPEYRYAAVDVFTCGETVNPKEACDYIAEYLGAKECKTKEVNRGLLEEPSNDKDRYNNDKREERADDNLKVKVNNKLNRLPDRIYRTIIKRQKKSEINFAGN